MRTSQSFGVHFTIKKDKAKDGVTNVYACITINKDRIHFALKHYVKVENWDKGRGGLKVKVPEAKETNAYLEEVKFTITTYYQQLQIAGKEVTPQLLKAMFLGEETEETFALSKLMDYHHEVASAVLTWSTLKHYAVTRRYLERFLREKRNTTDIRINEIDYKFIIDFETYLRNHKPKDHQKPLNNNGVMKHLIRLRKMTTLALKLTWISRDPFKNYKFRYKKVETAFLNQTELNAIQNKEFSVERLNMVRDLFIFSCYTGLSFVDLMNLKEGNITAGEDGNQWIKLFRQKSNEPTNIPLLPTAAKILERYRNCERAAITGTFKAINPDFKSVKLNIQDQNTNQVYHIPVQYSYGRAGRRIEVAGSRSMITVIRSPVTNYAAIGNQLASGKRSDVVDRKKIGGVKAWVNKLSLANNKVFFRLDIRNRSNLPYDVDFIRFYIRDLKTVARMATHEQEIVPIYSNLNKHTTILKSKEIAKVFGFHRFSLSDDQALNIELYERNGNRHLYLQIKQKDLDNLETINPAPPATAVILAANQSINSKY